MLSSVGFLQRAGPGHQSYPQGIEDHPSLIPDPDTLGWTPWKETLDLPLNADTSTPGSSPAYYTFPDQDMGGNGQAPARRGHCRRILRCTVFPEAAQMDAVRRLLLEVAGPHAAYRAPPPPPR